MERDCSSTCLHERLIRSLYLISYITLLFSSVRKLKVIQTRAGLVEFGLPYNLSREGKQATVSSHRLILRIKTHTRNPKTFCSLVTQVVPLKCREFRALTCQWKISFISVKRMHNIGNKVISHKMIGVNLVVKSNEDPNLCSWQFQIDTQWSVDMGICNKKH